MILMPASRYKRAGHDLHACELIQVAELIGVFAGCLKWREHNSRANNTQAVAAICQVRIHAHLDFNQCVSNQSSRMITADCEST
jgi:hypothetical protein